MIDRHGGSTPPLSSFLLYQSQSEDGKTRIQCRFQDESLWLTQALMAELFQTSVANINLHLKSIYEEGELSEGPTIKSYLIVRPEGERQVSRTVLHYSLPVILAVGYRVRSHRGTQFRQWATNPLTSRPFRTKPAARPPTPEKYKNPHAHLQRMRQ